MLEKNWWESIDGELKFVIYDTEFKIITTEKWKHIDNLQSREIFLGKRLGQTVVEIYEERKMDVAANLYLAFAYCIENPKGWANGDPPTWNEIIFIQEEYNKYWNKYKDKIELYRSFE